MELCLNTNQFNELSMDELLLVDAGGLLKTVFGVVGGIAGGAAAFIGVAASTAPVLTPFGSTVAGAVATPGGAAAGFAGGVTLYNYLFKK